MNDDLDLYGYKITEHKSVPGYTVEVQAVKCGLIDTFSASGLTYINDWLEDKYPQAIEIISFE